MTAAEFAMANVIHSNGVPRAVPVLLGIIAGFVDICAFLGLFNIFVAQLTGSFVYAGAQLIAAGHQLTAVLAIPAFFLAGCLATALALHRAPGGRSLAWVMALECVLLVAMLATMLTAPLRNADAPGVVAAVLLGVSAMGVQSAMVRLFMRGGPSTNVMTTNTTQLAIDATVALISIMRRRPANEAEAGQTRAVRERLALYWPPMAGFMAGTAAGALAYVAVGAAALTAPLLIACTLFAWSTRRGSQPAPV
jgi:uncharacterized membrane protein YoaK (UPF0700 family)